MAAHFVSRSKKLAPIAHNCLWITACIGMKTHQAPQWVIAGPFRAHVHYLLGTARLPWRALAIYADVPANLVRSLAHGRPGTPHRIPAGAARALLAVTPELLAETRHTPVRARRAGQAVAFLHGIGWSTDRIAATGGLRSDEIEAALSGSLPFTTRHSELLLVAAADEIRADRVRPRRREAA